MNVFSGLSIYFAITLPLAAVIVTASYRKFKFGIPTRLFSMVCLIAIVTGISGHIAGTMGNNFSGWSRGILVASTMLIIAVPAYALYRFVVSDIQVQISQLMAGTSQIAATTRQSAAVASEQASVVLRVSSTVDEIHQMSNSTMLAAQKVLEMTASAADQGLGGRQSIEKAARIMTLVGNVVEIVETVEGFAEQSNLLALNASIEAAKAGDHGRGFSVVAAEVKNLAGLSKNATTKIREAIQRVKEGKEAIDSSSETFKGLMTVLQKSADSAREIYTAASEQVEGIEQLNESMDSVAMGGRDTANSVRKLETALVSLNNISSSLHRLATGSEPL